MITIPYSRDWRSFWLVGTLCLPLLFHSLPSIAEPIIYPRLSVDQISGNCTSWSARVIYTATQGAPDLANQLIPYGAFSVFDHGHFGWDSNWNPILSWMTNQYMSGSPLEKLKAINMNIFGTDKPPLGMTYSRMVNHVGQCANEYGLTECVGIFVSPSKGSFRTQQPTTFPANSCWGVIPDPEYKFCKFDLPTAIMDLGVGPKGIRNADIDLTVNCNGSVNYTISLFGSPDGVLRSTGMTSQLQVDSKNLPVTLRGNSGKNKVRLSTKSALSEEGDLQQSGTLLLDML